jgi:hypothetical protein
MSLWRVLQKGAGWEMGRARLHVVVDSPGPAMRDLGGGSTGLAFKLKPECFGKHKSSGNVIDRSWIKALLPPHCRPSGPDERKCSSFLSRGGISSRVGRTCATPALPTFAPPRAPASFRLGGHRDLGARHCDEMGEAARPDPEHRVTAPRNRTVQAEVARELENESRNVSENKRVIKI